MFDNLATCRALARAGYRPYETVYVRGRRMEAISLPFPLGDDVHFGLMVREHDDPTTMVEWTIPPVDVARIVNRKW